MVGGADREMDGQMGGWTWTGRHGLCDSVGSEQVQEERVDGYMGKR